KDGSALFLQQREIVFQVIDALLSFETPPVPGNTLSPKVKGDRFLAGSDGYLVPTVGSRDGVVICIKTNGTEPVVTASDTLAWVQGRPVQGIQFIQFLHMHFAYRRLFSANLMGQILLALFPEHTIQLFNCIHFGDRNTDIASDIAHQSFYQPLFIPRRRIAEYGFEAIVGRQGCISRLFPGMSAKTVFDSDLSIVKDNPFRNTAEILEHLHQRVQEALFILPAISKDDWRITVT